MLKNQRTIEYKDDKDIKVRQKTRYLRINGKSTRRKGNGVQFIMKKRATLFIGLCMLMLTGCSRKDDVISRKLNAYIEDSVMNESDIKTDESYVRYEQISNDEEISDEGFFYSDDVDYSILEDKDAVHVTFAVNSYIEIQYFDDPAMTNLLNSEGTYLHVNDCIYANIQEINNPNTDAYQFSGFEVWEYDENGKKKKEWEAAPFEDALIFQIPMDFTGKEISIVPLGEYTFRNIVLNDYYKDNNGVEKALEGTWDVNGEKTTNNSANVNPVAPYTISYMYDPNAYVFVDSVPACQHNNEIDGIVIFEEFSADQNISDFSVELHKKSGELEFDPSKYKIENADVEYKYQGVAIESPTFIPNNSKIMYEITRVDDGYWISGDRKGEVEVGDIAETIANLVCKEENVKVMLPQPERGGTITYSLDGKVLDGDNVETLIGSEISMTFQRKNGWTCDAIDGTVYKVVSKEVQKINVDGKDVNDIFTEQQYKPNVSLTIDKSVGTDIEFEISAVDIKETKLKLEKPKQSKKVFNKEVGTKNDLTITASGGALLDGEALKVAIQKEKVNGNKEIDIQYLEKIPASLDISLYIENSNAIYESVRITVSKVGVVYVSNQKIENGFITIETTDLTNNRYLNSENVIENSRKVKISVSARSGYYVKDSGKIDQYVDTMKYSKYVSDIEKIISKHPVKKLCNVILDATDSYGKVTYKIDGKAVEAGVYELKEEQKLEIMYEITDGHHVIKREGANWFENSWNKTKNKTKETVEIPITASLDGKEVSRDVYINIESK